jgi:hypothetical protein
VSACEDCTRNRVHKLTCTTFIERVVFARRGFPLYEPLNLFFKKKGQFDFRALSFIICELHRADYILKIFTMEQFERR